MNLLAALLIVGLQEPKPGEAKVAELLTATQLNFAKSATGLAFEIPFEHPDNRRQIVWVSTVEQSVLSLRTHLVYTQVWFGKEPPSPALMKFVFAKAKKIGTFYILKDTQGTYAIRFGAHFDTSTITGKPTPGDTASTGLKDLISFVDAVGYETAVQVEKEFGKP